jgi:signal peptidase I
MPRARDHGIDDEPRRRPGAWWAIEWIAILGAALVLALGVRAYVVQTYYIPSGSMEPTLAIGDKILVLKVAYDFTQPAIGDVVVFRAPKAEIGHCGDPGVADLVKRIVGLPGDHISSRGNAIVVDGHVLPERWPHDEPLLTPITPQVVPKGRYFVMGDNHPASCDSRDWGTLPAGDIIGKVVLRIWPLSQFGTV